MSTLAIIITVLSLLLITAIYVIINLSKKVLLHEAHMLNLDARLVKILTTLQLIDNKEMFEDDDEIGQLYKQIKKAILQLEKYIIT